VRANVNNVNIAIPCCWYLIKQAIHDIEKLQNILWNKLNQYFNGCQWNNTTRITTLCPYYFKFCNLMTLYRVYKKVWSFKLKSRITPYSIEFIWQAIIASNKLATRKTKDFLLMGHVRTTQWNTLYSTVRHVFVTYH
jgi:hypothetical protein